MSSYNYFSNIYDDLTENVDYEVRSDYISGFFNELHVRSGALLLDLACGTGSFSLIMKNKGYSVIGIDASEEMLSVADSKAEGKIPFLKAKMQNFSLSEPADACICCLDSINHLGSLKDVENTFKCVYNSVKENGVFIFDVNTVYKHNKVLADNAFVFDQENYFLSWDNELLDNGTVRIILDIFVKENDSYKRYSEEFTETAYELDVLKSALNPYFDVLGIYDELTKNAPHKRSERVYFVCRRK